MKCKNIINKYITTIDLRFAFLLSALCHDVGHTGEILYN